MPATAPQDSAATAQQHRSEFHSLTLEGALDDLSARFIVNLPHEELNNMDRLGFQVEQAHWYYEDFVRPQGDPALLPSLGLKQFSLLMFRTCPMLAHMVGNHADIWSSFMAYKERVPVCGAVLISEYWDKVLLVRGWGKGASWSFPRGKINKEETDAMCAVREVLEETGFDLRDRFPPDQLIYPYETERSEKNPFYAEMVMKEQKIRLYFISGVPEDTAFETRTRKEISKIAWFKVSELPTWSRDKKAAKKAATAADQKSYRYYMVTPFISQLKLWIDRNKPKHHRRRSQQVPVPRTLTDSTLVGSERTLVPYVDSDAPLDSDYDYYQSPAPSSDEDITEEEDEGVRRTFEFATLEEGDLALNSFFFGGGAGTQVDTQQPPEPTAHSFAFPNSTPAGQTPPHVAYERNGSGSIAHPKPNPPPEQVNKLLALLISPHTPAPPSSDPPPSLSPPHRYLDDGPREGGNLLETLQSQMVSGYRRGRPTSSVSSAGGHSSPGVEGGVLFGNSATPPEAEGFDFFRSRAEIDMTEAERQEKRQALVRALFEVVQQQPPLAPRRAESPRVPDNLAALFRSVKDASVSPNQALPWARSPSPEMAAALGDLNRATSRESTQTLSSDSSGHRRGQVLPSPPTPKPASPNRESNALLAFIRGEDTSDGERRPPPAPSPSAASLPPPVSAMQSPSSNYGQGFPAFHQQQASSYPSPPPSQPSQTFALYPGFPGPQPGPLVAQGYPSNHLPPILPGPQNLFGPGQLGAGFMAQHPHGSYPPFASFGPPPPPQQQYPNPPAAYPRPLPQPPTQYPQGFTSGNANGTSRNGPVPPSEQVRIAKDPRQAGQLLNLFNAGSNAT